MQENQARRRVLLRWDVSQATVRAAPASLQQSRILLLLRSTSFQAAPPHH